MLFQGIARFYLCKPELKDLLKIKYPSTSAVAKGFSNEIFYLLKTTRGFFLDSVNIEITNACNLKCTICPVSGRMTRPVGYMEADLFRKIVDQHTWGHVLLFQWGEPLLHPEIFDMISYTRSRNIPAMITTNGVLLEEDTIVKLIQSGLSRITVSVDGSPRNFEKIRNVSYSSVKEKILLLKKIRDQHSSSLKIDISMVVNSGNERSVPEYFSEWEGTADRVQLVPQLKNGRRTARCREMWRGAVVVLWDGRVVPCCVDYDARMVVGDARHDPLADIWNGPQMRELRKSHVLRKFTGVCRECDEYETRWVHKRFS